LAKRSSSSENSSTGSGSSKGASDELVGWSTLAIGLSISTLLLWKNGGWPVFRCSTYMSVVEFNLFNICMLLAPTLSWILIGLRRELSDFGLTPGNAKGALILSLIVGVAYIPVLALFSGQKAFQAYYTGVLTNDRVLYNVGWMNGKLSAGQIDYGRFVQHELMMVMYMFAWEWFFRGYLLFGLRKIMPTWAAAIVQALPFFILHLGKPPAELWSSLAGGLLLAPVALRYKSFLPCFLMHYFISLGNDIAVLYFHFR
jgi:membrane protease YdiL (CAAX protease family)